MAIPESLHVCNIPLGFTAFQLDSIIRHAVGHIVPITPLPQIVYRSGKGFVYLRYKIKGCVATILKAYKKAPEKFRAVKPDGKTVLLTLASRDHVPVAAYVDAPVFKPSPPALQLKVVASAVSGAADEEDAELQLLQQQIKKQKIALLKAQYEKNQRLLEEQATENKKNDEARQKEAGLTSMFQNLLPAASLAVIVPKQNFANKELGVAQLAAGELASEAINALEMEPWADVGAAGGGSGGSKLTSWAPGSADSAASAGWLDPGAGEWTPMATPSLTTSPQGCGDWTAGSTLSVSADKEEP